jgi:hypothetical protein
MHLQPAKESLEGGLSVIFIYLLIHVLKWDVQVQASLLVIIYIRSMVMTGNILYLSLITWLSLTSIKKMEHSPDEFKVGRWS